MFQLSKKTCYGIKAIFELTVAYKNGSISTSSIAEKQKIPIPFLEKIIYELRKGGIVKSKRGPGGGHKLARSPEVINFRTIIEILEGPSFLNCVDDKFDINACDQYELCPSRILVTKIVNQIKDILDNTTLLDMVNCWIEKARNQ